MEDTESIQVLVAGKEEVRRILREEKVSIRAAYLLMNFLHAESENPFAFLK
jgi:ADP-ribose pyrophosphatase